MKETAHSTASGRGGQSVLDWSRIDTVFMDMDGTLLDLHYDNRFWQEHVPLRWGEKNGLTQQQAFDALYPRFKAKEGSLDWYCLDFWQRELELDIVALKHELAHLIRVLPHVHEFLHAVRETGKRLVLVTNAHGQTLELKMAHVDIGRHFDLVLSAHEFGLPKEGKGFWDRVKDVEVFEKARAVLVDDSVNVLRAARAYGMGQLVCMRRPDWRLPARVIDEFPAVETLKEIMPE